MSGIGCFPQILIGIVIKTVSGRGGTTCVLLKNDVLDDHFGVVRAATEVKDHLYGSCVDAGQADEFEGELLVGFDVTAFGEQEVVIAGSVGELEGHTGHVLAQQHFHLEIVGLFGRKGKSGGLCGNHKELGLPLRAGGRFIGEAVRRTVLGNVRVGKT